MAELLVWWPSRSSRFNGFVLICSLVLLSSCQNIKMASVCVCVCVGDGLKCMAKKEGNVRQKEAKDK